HTKTEEETVKSGSCQRVTRTCSLRKPTVAALRPGPTRCHPQEFGYGLVFCYNGFACGSRAGGRRSRKRSEESPDSQGRVLGNAQAERSDTGATESTPPMAGVLTNVGSGKGEKAG